MEQTILDHAVVTRRIIGALFVTQSLASAAFIANIAVNAIVGAQLSGNDALAGCRQRSCWRELHCQHIRPGERCSVLVGVRD